MVDKESFPDLRPRVNLNSSKKTGDLRDQTRQQKKPAPIKPVGNPIGHKSMKTGITKDHFPDATRRRIPLENCFDFLP
jgi:hypothetical protein